MRIGSVVAPGPVVKLAITRSSSDRAKASIHAAAIAGKISGSVTDEKVRNGEAPRSIAASSRLKSKSTSRDCTMMVTKHIAMVVWAMATVQKPRSAATATNNNSNDSPVMTSGMTSGAYHGGEQQPAAKTAEANQRQRRQRSQYCRRRRRNDRQAKADQRRADQRRVGQKFAVPAYRPAAPHRH